MNQLFTSLLLRARCFLWSQTPAARGRIQYWARFWWTKLSRSFSARAGTFPSGKPTNILRWRRGHTSAKVAEFASSFSSSHTGGLRLRSRRTEYQLFSSSERPLGTDAGEKAKKKFKHLTWSVSRSRESFLLKTCHESVGKVKLVAFYCRVRI